MKYKPGPVFRIGHLNTIYPTLFRRQKRPEYHRIEIDTSDGDFLHIDTLFKANKRLVILCHGLEGSSESKYMIGAADLLSENNWDVAAMNYRSCSGVMNSNLRMYHSGATDDLHEVISAFEESYDEIALVGFSLGGNLCLKYTGERSDGINTKIKSVVAISVPADLKAGSLNIGKASNFIYEKKFMITLKEKMREKAIDFPEQVNLDELEGLVKLYDFDDVYTGPIHGFSDAEDYYAQCSSKIFLKHIEIPAIIINALDDPFLPEECYPAEEASANEHIELILPKYGGHVGFVKFRQKHYWIEEMILSMINKHSEFN